ncbi:MAG TPA: serine hydrolase [Thermoanaerobaculia bacterium]|nr:serine hydrolase [Thermoanaerobaculia bacterium]
MLIAAFLVALALPANAAPEKDLTGLWGVEMIRESPARGQLTIDARSEPWRALLGGFNVAVESSGAAVSFKLPAGAGEFRGRVSADSRSIAGQWIQPPSPLQFNTWATPVVLRQVKGRVWRGDVVPLEERTSFYVSIAHAVDGSMSATVRNPEFNWFRRRGFDVRLTGTRLLLTDKHDPSSTIEGTWDGADDLRLELVSGLPPVALTRRNAAETVALSPRITAERSYVYRPPIAEDDGWPTATLADAGIDPGPIAKLIERIAAGDPALLIDSLLIARHGKLVLEEYFYGWDAERPHDTRSAGKTFAPMLVGIARRQGAKVGPDTPVYGLFESYAPFAKWDGRKAKMKLGDLMSMTAGYDCDEDDRPDALLNEGTMQNQTAQPDWYKYALDAPMAHDPGGRRAYYCSAELNLAGGAAAKASGKWLPDLFYEGYARPLQFHRYHLNLMPTGEAYMGGGARIRPRDQLKLGQLYLDGGTWNGRRIVSREWVRQSLEVHSEFQPRFDVDHQYGWGWHIHHLKAGGRTYTEYESGGNGGQLVLVFPELDLVIGFTGSAYGDFASWGRWSVQLVPQSILPAVR